MCIVFLCIFAVCKNTGEPAGMFENNLRTAIKTFK